MSKRVTIGSLKPGDFFVFYDKADMPEGYMPQVYLVLSVQKEYTSSLVREADVLCSDINIGMVWLYPDYIRVYKVDVTITVSE